MTDEWTDAGQRTEDPSSFASSQREAPLAETSIRIHGLYGYSGTFSLVPEI